MTFMKVVIRSTGILALLLSAACSRRSLTITPPTAPTPPPAASNSEESPVLTVTPITPVGVQVVMSDGSVVTYPLGIYLQFQNGVLRGVFPTQYVDQIAVVQPDGTWKYSRPGRNVQVWRNGSLQRRGPDYTLNQAAATLTPVKYPDANGVPIGWNNDDYVTVAYLY